MVPIRLGLAARAACCFALIVATACGRRAADAETSSDTTVAGVAVNRVRAFYRAGDIVASGAWTWTAPNGAIFVMMDVQSTIDGVVQGRTDLWAVADTAVMTVGKSDVMPAAAEFGAYAFEDLTGDGLPDLFGYVADSAGVSFPVFVPGAWGAMTEEIAPATQNWVFATEEPDLPKVVRGGALACALQIWASEPAPDGQPAGWRYLSLRRDGSLGTPQSRLPDCSTGLQPDSTSP
jgi:hypothetical protein